ncbi:hypothetical protein CRG98_015359 [Punica granatum]|uniref:Uncharacterized protein n=1 Tax=Punica granatum TaxID=22663 RepID=A0A2I0K6R6_PUNGR|nr:hypothetical protein CRG98_015359 [Punica granatum]
MAPPLDVIILHNELGFDINGPTTRNKGCQQTRVAQEWGLEGSSGWAKAIVGDEWEESGSELEVEPSARSWRQGRGGSEELGSELSSYEA